MVDTFGQQSNSLVTFSDIRPPSVCGISRQNNGIKSETPPQMYTLEEAPMATEEQTGTSTVNSSPCKMPSSGRTNGSNFHLPKMARNGTNTNNNNNNNHHNNNNQRTANLLMRKNGLPWLLASAVVVIFVLLILCAFLLYILYEHHGIHSQISGTLPNLTRHQSQKIHNSDDETKNVPKWPKQNYRTMEANFKRAVVLSENGMCSEIGRKVLLQGGNAVDAALSVGFCVGALNPHSAGLGGGFLMTYYQRFYGKCTTIDARETAPARTAKDTFSNGPKEDSQFGKQTKHH
ncbi:hypothetical protein niasHT_024277 [Heterodera trifolii]|uniref:Uncharacterized protein n=1 Tax=Heterodera trifolii TaxID=157864 RepID=A0ABD2JM41_9BILA